jgi:Right handed beta helix region
METRLPGVLARATAPRRRRKSAIALLATPFIVAMTPDLARAETILPSGDDAAAINAVLAKGGQAMLQNTGKPYVLNDSLVFAAGAALVAQPGTVVELAVAKPFFKVPAGAHDVKIRDVVFDGSRLSVARPAVPCYAPNFSWIGGGMRHGAPLFLLPGCDGAFIQRVRIDFSSAGAVDIHGGNRAQVLDSEFDNNVGFGILVTEGSSGFKLSGNRSNANGIELIGVTYSAHDGEIVKNRAVGSGDNCISVSGRRVAVTDNEVASCLASGFVIYGDENTVRNNKSTSNGQVANPAAPAIRLWDGSVKPVYKSSGYSMAGAVGIGVFGGFGGYGQNNHVEDNLVTDNQRQPTQGGIAVHTGIRPWAQGHFSPGAYVFANGSTYKAVTTGESATMPAGSPEFRDGPLVWQWCSRPILETREAVGNVVTRNRVVGYKGAAIVDATAEHRNVVQDNMVQDGAAGPQAR